MALAGLAERLRSRGTLLAVQAANAVGIAYGFYYYTPQFEATPAWLWPLVPDSPFAVLLMALALGFLMVGSSKPWLNLLGAGAMVKVGIWTAVVLAWFPAHFGFSWLPQACPTGLLGCGNLNTVLFYLHLGMALEALIVIDRLPKGPVPYLAVGGAFVLHDAVDYLWPVDYLNRGCSGIFPHTVPCIAPGALFAVTVGLSVAAVGGLWWARCHAEADPPD